MTEERRNVAVAQATAFVEAIGSTPMNSALSDMLVGVLSELEGMDEIRAQVDAFTIEKGQAIAYYTRLNSGVLNVIHEMSLGKAPSAPEIWGLTNDFDFFEQWHQFLYLT